MLLQLYGYETDTAYDGLEGVEAAEQLRPDAVLLDIGMPRLNGYDACRRIREKSWGKGLVLIAMTGWGQEEDRLRTMEAGFDAHIIKPVDPTDLIKLLASLFIEDWQLTNVQANPSFRRHGTVAVWKSRLVAALNRSPSMLGDQNRRLKLLSERSRRLP